MLKPTLAYQSPQTRPVLKHFLPWKTIHVEFGSAREYRAALAKNNFAITTGVTKMLPYVRGVMGPREVTIYRQSVESVGFLGGVQLMEIHERIDELGFMMCMPEIGPAVRLRYTHQPLGEKLFCAMKPLVGRMFVIENDGGSMILASSEALLDGYWRLEDEFLLQKKI